MSEPKIYTQADLDRLIAVDRKARGRLAAIREHCAWNAALAAVEIDTNRHAGEPRYGEFYDGWVGAIDSIHRVIRDLQRNDDDYPRED